MKLLYVDGELIDLYPNTVIAQTLQVWDPGRVGSIVTNYTASVRVPRTAINDRVFRFLAYSKSQSNVPYTSLSCRYEENGIPVIRDGRIILNEAREKEYTFTINSGPWGFFETIQSKKLWNLDFSDINGPWTESDRDAYRNATTGIVQALVDDGRLDQDQASTAPTIENQGDILKAPQIYYHTVIAKIFQGFEVDGDIFDNVIFKNLALPLRVDYQDTAWLEAKLFYAAAPGDQEMLNPTTETAVIFNTQIRQGSENFYDGNSEYVVVNPDTAARYFQPRFIIGLTLEVVGGTVDIILQATGYVDSAEEINVGTGTYAFEYLPSLGLKDGDVVRIVIKTRSGTPVVTIVAGQFHNMILSGTDGFSFSPSIVQDYVYFNKLFNDILIIDFLKEFCVRFNVQITQINNVLHVNTANKILDDATGPDWTLKRNKGYERIKYAFSSYAQTNYLKAPVDEEFSPDISDSYGDGTFAIPNENLKPSATLYTSMYYASQMITTFGVFMLHLNLEPDFGSIARPAGDRLFFVREPYDWEPPCLYHNVDRDDYLIGFYFDPYQERHIGWQFFIDTFYTKFVDRCLRKVRLVEREYNLSDLDIFTFNQQIPIYDDSERFLVVKIMNRVSRKACRVQLLKIEPNPEHYFVQNIANNISAAIEDLIEVIADNVVSVLSVEMELQESVMGNPTWQCTFDNGDSVVVIAVGDEATDTDTLDHEGELDVDADVLKTNNDGNGPDGFPVISGWVEWLRNGVQVNTKTFDSSSHSSLQDLNYTYPDVKAWETLKVIVHEDGTNP